MSCAYFGNHITQIPVGGSGTKLHTIHRFFDSSAISPSGKLAAVVQLPTFIHDDSNEFHFSSKYSAAKILLSDLNSSTNSIIDMTLAWDTQLGSQLQWGLSDRELFYNVLESNNIHSQRSNTTSSCVDGDSCMFQSNGYWTLRGMKYNYITNAKKLLDCPIYHISANGNYGIAPNLMKIHHIQHGYGIRLFQVFDSKSNANQNAPQDDGLFITNTQDGSCMLHTSLHELARSAGLDTRNTPTYGFHTKFSTDGELIMFVVRTLELPIAPRANRVRVQHLFVLNRTEYSENNRNKRIRRMISWASYPFIPAKCKEINFFGACRPVHLPDGNHPNWIPGTHRISMNLQVPQVKRGTALKTRHISTKEDEGRGERGEVGAISSMSRTVAQSMLDGTADLARTVHEYARASTVRMGATQKRWSIVSFNVDDYPENYNYPYEAGVVSLTKYLEEVSISAEADAAATITSTGTGVITGPRAGVVAGRDPLITDTRADAHTDSGTDVMLSKISPTPLIVHIDYPLGSGHPTYHPSGKYIITDAYPKEVHLLPSSSVCTATSLSKGEVPLRLIHIPTQREVWLLKVQVLRFPPGNATSLAPANIIDWVSWIRSGIRHTTKRAKIPKNKLQERSYEHFDELEIDSISTSESTPVSTTPTTASTTTSTTPSTTPSTTTSTTSSSTISLSSAQSATRRQQQPNRMVEDQSWRCDLHPAWNSDYSGVVINARPSGDERQVIFVPLKKDLSWYFDPPAAT